MPDGPARTILLEGWRRIPHSYALVMGHTALELARRPGLKLYFRDQPFYSSRWQPVSGLYSPADEHTLDTIPPPPEGLIPDAVYRADFPLRLAENSPGNSRCILFGSTEHGRIDPAGIHGNLPVADALARSRVRILAPSNWARAGFLASGAPPARVGVLPHGIDPSLHRPLPPDQRAALRAELGWSDRFIFLHISALTPNKNVPAMVRAMTQVAALHPRAHLVLKGVDGLFSSRSLFAEATHALSSRDQQTLRDRVTYSGESLPAAGLARLYQAADAYLAPYSAEGFCLPVLEAAACGLPVICTQGGPTDDFTTADFALPIRSRKMRPTFDVGGSGGPPGSGGGGGGWQLVPDEAALVQQMRRVVDDAAFRARAAQAGPAHTHAKFAWPRIVDRLLAELLP